MKFEKIKKIVIQESYVNLEKMKILGLAYLILNNLNKLLNWY